MPKPRHPRLRIPLQQQKIDRHIFRGARGPYWQDVQVHRDRTTRELTRMSANEKPQNPLHSIGAPTP
jgi:hypothetical protein